MSGEDDCRLYIERMPNGGVVFMHGDLGPHCKAGGCLATSGYLCDFPVAESQTCDRPLCEEHAAEVAPETHYCPDHFAMWERFRNAGGVERELANVVPYKRNQPGATE